MTPQSPRDDDAFDAIFGPLASETPSESNPALVVTNDGNKAGGAEDSEVVAESGDAAASLTEATESSPAGERAPASPSAPLNSEQLVSEQLPPPVSRREARERAATGAVSIAAPLGSATTPAVAPAATTSAEPPPATASPDDAPPSDGRNDRASRRSSARAYPPAEKRSKKGLIATIVTLVIVGGIAGGGLYVWNTFEDEILGWVGPNDYEGSGRGEVLVQIASGDTGTDIAQTLTDEGVTKSVTAFVDLLAAQSSEPIFHPGIYTLAKKMSAQAALDGLLDPANKVKRTVLLREGITGAAILTELSENLAIPLADLEAAVADPTVYGIPAGVPSIEGWLFPAQYTFDPGLSAQQVIQVLVDRTISALDAAQVPVDQRERILTIASIIQREARIEEDFYKVSRVIQNRVDQGMKLQMDSTAQYGIKAGTDSVWSSREALYSDNPWNTYKHPGLPIGPISSPGDVAIAAAMAPADGSWLYFVTVNLDTGETVFSDDFASHEAAVAQLKQWCTDNPGKGC